MNLQRQAARCFCWTKTTLIVLQPAGLLNSDVTGLVEEIYYIMENLLLKNVNKEKDLGVTIDNELTFHEHVSPAVKKQTKFWV